jgi:hypothetical protein
MTMSWMQYRYLRADAIDGDVHWHKLRGLYLGKMNASSFGWAIYGNVRELGWQWEELNIQL